MFSGIVEEVGTFIGNEGNRFRFRADRILYDTRVGDYIAVNGCGVSVVEVGDDWLGAELPAEVVESTTFMKMQPGGSVNLERAMRAADRMRGHFSQGFIDGIGEIVEPAPALRVKIPADLLPMVATKGAISVDGVSLSVVQAFDDGFTATITDYTLERTTLGERKPGDLVNLEVELVAKYVNRVLVLKQEMTAERCVESVSGREG